MEDNEKLLLNDLMNEEYYLMDEEDYQVDFDVSIIKFFRMAGFSMLNKYILFCNIKNIKRIFLRS